MRRFRDLPIRQKLTLVNVLTGSVALLLASFAFVAIDLVTFRAAMVRQLSTQARIIGDNSTAAILFNDRESATKTLAALRAEPHIIAASIHNPLGEVFASYLPKQSAIPVTIPDRLGPEEAGVHFGADRLVLVEGIFMEGDRIGSVRIVSDLAEFQARLRRYVAIVAGVLLVAIAIAYAVSSLVQQAISGPILHLVSRVRIVSEEKNYAVRATPTSNDELGLLINAFNDMLSQIQQRDEALEKARDEAEAANRSKDEFLAVVSHELRTPLTPILMWTNMLRGGTLDADTVRRGLQVIESSTKAQAQLIEDLLDVSRIVSGKLRLDIRPIELPPVIEGAMESVRAASEAKGIRLDATFDETIGRVPADPERLRQVLWNLLANAVKFTPRGGVVAVALRRADSSVEIAVSDTGEGISRAFLPHVFERFKQADSTTTRPHGGLGLGLAIVRHLVELHGGTVAADSAGEGTGATFTVRLPIPGVAAIPSERHTIDPPVRRGSALPGDSALAGVRVLVVDDEENTCDSIRAVLAQCGAEVESALSAPAAMRVLERWVPDVLISDIGMSGEDGYALIRHVRAHERAHGLHIGAIALTAFARVEDRLRALSEGFQIHLPKPVDPFELVAVVASLAHGRGAEASKVAR